MRRVSWGAWAAVIVIAVLLGADARSYDRATPIPVTLDGNVVLLRPVFADGRQLRVLADSGGYDLIAPDAVQRFGFATAPVRLGGTERETASLPAFRPDSGIGAQSARWLIARPTAFSDTFTLPLDATAGAPWFLANRVTIDYPRRQVEIGGAVPSGVARVALHTVIGTRPAASLPRPGLAVLDVEIAGESLTMLLDTGSTAMIPERLRARMPDTAAVRQVSFADAALVERWHRAHPDWPYDARGALVPGSGGAHEVPIARVPAVDIGPLTSPPVWFAARERAGFDALSGQMHRRVSGDLGGDALRTWRATIDLTNEALWLD